MNAGKLDEIDLRILAVLQQNARMGVGRIGRLVGLSETPVATRIEKMEQAGIIKQYTAVLDREKTGSPVLVVLLVRLKDAGAVLIGRFEELTGSMPEVQQCMLISGSWNFVLHVQAATPQAYAGWLLEHILSQDYIAQVESAYLMRESKCSGAPKIYAVNLLPGERKAS